MKIAETVTFGGSALNRAAELREKSRELMKTPNAQAILLWRGKPLFHEENLAYTSCDHPLIKSSNEVIFLGLQEDQSPVFAADISDWEPDNLDEESLNTFLDPSAQSHPDLPQDTAFLELRAVMARLSTRDAELAATARAVFSWHQSHCFCSACGQPSQLAMGGWQRDCPSCDAKHFPRTDPVVIMLITHGNSVLLGRSPFWPEGMYSLLAGFIEPGETMEAAVRREVLEESNVKVGQVTYLASQPWPFPNSLMFGCHGVATSTEIKIDPNELEDALWVTREELAIVFAGQHPKILPAREGAIAHFLLRNWLSDQLS